MSEFPADLASPADVSSNPPAPGTETRAANADASPAGVAPPVPIALADPKSREFVEEWRNASYNCFSSGHKFCREVCPVTQVAHNDSWTPTAFHANVVAMERGELSIGDIAADYVNCTQCGACELRCPNTLFAGDFYRFRTRTVDVVKAARALAVSSGIHQPRWRSWTERTDEFTHEPVLGETAVCPESVREWANDLDLPIGGETVLFVDCEAAFFRTSVPRAAAQLLQMARYEFGLMEEQWCCGGPAAEMGYVEQAERFACHNLDNWRRSGTKRVLVLDPHDYITFTEDYPKYFGAEFDIEIVLVIEVLAELIRHGKLTPSVPLDRAVTYHDPCRLNKRKGIWKEPREILRAIPGLAFADVDHVTQWSYCSGGGGGLPVEKPELAAAISEMRLERAVELEIDTLVTACPWAERPLTAAGAARGVDVVDVLELLAESLGIRVGGRRGDHDDETRPNGRRGSRHHLGREAATKDV